MTWTESRPRRRPGLVAGAAASAVVVSLLAGPDARAAGDLAAPDGPAGGRPSPGAPGIGDTLYPTLGNGGYTVAHYDLDLRYATSAPSQALDGTVTVHAVATQALSRFDLDFSGTGVGDVIVDGRAAAFRRDGEELVITPARPVAKGSPFVVTVRHFTAAPTVANSADFLSTIFVQTPDGSVWSGQPNESHRIFPCNDHPKDKASFSYRIDVPAGTTAVANGVLADRRTASGRTVYRYEQPEPMATELAQVAVGALTVVPRATTDGVVVRDVLPTRLVADLGPKLAVENAQLQWMRRKVGGYPFRTYGSLVADADLGFALETQTLSLYDLSFFRYPQSVWDPVMLHELAHQWFGDSVAPSDWKDVWQNEGHATWYEYQYAAEKGFLADDSGTGIADFTELMKYYYSVGDQYRAEDGPVGRPKSGDVNDVFNENVYNGGALVLYALQQKIGDAAFQRVERAWVSTYQGKSASTADFIRLAASIGGPGVAPFLQTWLYGTKTPPMPGHPDWTVDPVTAGATTARTAAPAGGLKPLVRR